MSEFSKDDGVAVAIIERLVDIRLPRVLTIKARVDKGEKLGDEDIDYLDRILEDAEEVRRFIDHRPELQDLYARVIGLYHDITEKALENEQGA